MTSTEKRPWLAALLAFVYPGLGHLYLREWLRALLWFGLVVTTAVVFMPEEAMRLAEAGDLEGAIAASQNPPTDFLIPILVVRVMSSLDAYWSALRGNRALTAAARNAAGVGGAPDVDREGDDRSVRCPECGREVDADLDFCQWCTAEFGEATSR